MLSRNEIMEILGANREGLRRDFGVESMALFGFAARGDGGPVSDVDVGGIGRRLVVADWGQV